MVYKARDTHLNRLVALKVVPPHEVADAERKRRASCIRAHENRPGVPTMAHWPHRIETGEEAEACCAPMWTRARQETEGSTSILPMSERGDKSPEQ